jgi:hypothetical protein
MSEKNSTQKRNADVAMIAGIQKHLPTATFLIDGAQTPASQVMAVIQRRVDARTRPRPRPRRSRGYAGPFPSSSHAARRISATAS